MIDWHEYENFEGLNSSLAATMAAQLQEKIKQSGEAVLAVSGGNTPKQLFHCLSQLDINWSCVTIVLVDERWVATEQSTSNEYLVREYLLQHFAQAARFIGLKNQYPTAQLGQSMCNEQLAGIEHIDVLLLGMGDDGHTASIFPCLDEAHLNSLLDIQNPRKAMAVTPATAPHERMTLTASFLLKSQHRYLLIKGEHKKHVYQQAMHNDQVSSMPIRLFMHATDTPLQIYYAL